MNIEVLSSRIQEKLGSLIKDFLTSSIEDKWLLIEITEETIPTVKPELLQNLLIELRDIFKEIVEQEAGK